MKEINYKKIEKILKLNGNYITRKDVDEANIASWFLSDFVKKNKLNKIAPGVYADDSFIVDEYFLLQKRFPKFIFSGMSALYLHGLTDKIVTSIEVTAPQGYNPTRNKLDQVVIHRISNHEIYSLGIVSIKTIYGNDVNVYDAERTICDIVKNRNKYDSETFIKAIKWYVKRINNQFKLFNYAKILKVEKELFEIMEILFGED